jgi:hypothetical protein
MDSSERQPCPHCGQPMSFFLLPEGGGWETLVQLVCFNDDCPYYQRGWTWMFEHYGVKASLRHRVDPTSGRSSPIPVWSPTALRERIVSGPTQSSESPGQSDPPGKSDPPDGGHERETTDA